MDIAKKYNLKVLEDATEALGNRLQQPAFPMFIHKQRDIFVIIQKKTGSKSLFLSDLFYNIDIFCILYYPHCLFCSAFLPRHFANHRLCADK